MSVEIIKVLFERRGLEHANELTKKRLANGMKNGERERERKREST
jgi:hypothetical protein